MRFSEAIRLGAMLKPQGFGTTHDVSKETCANFAALDAAGGLDPRNAFFSVFPQGLIMTEGCPVQGCSEGSDYRHLSAVTAHLDDFHRWTREQIADWVETIEEQFQSANAESSQAALDSPEERQKREMQQV